MEKKINIAKLLKDCPKGMDLYSPLCGDCKLYDVNDYNIRIEASNKDALICLYHDGRYCANGEVMLFPKGKTTWEGFQRPFEDGDIIYIKTSSSEWISIFEKFDDDECKCYVNYCIDSDTYYGKIGGKKNLLCDIDEIVEQRLATEEEKQKLFDVIKEHGHQWNTKTKTLEKLIKFKIGDRIKKSDKYRSSIVVEIKDDCFIIKTLDGLHHSYLTDKLPFSIQDEYELVTDKFNINTLKPFDKVLVRDSDKEYWSINLFGFYNEIIKQFHCMGNTNIGWNECIPYEGNEHLLGTTNNCDNYYKNW